MRCAHHRALAGAAGILARLGPEQWKKIGIGAAIVAVLGIAIAGFMLPDGDDAERPPARPRIEPVPEEEKAKPPPPEPKWVPPAVQDITAPETLEAERRAAEEAAREEEPEPVEPEPVRNGRLASAVPEAERKTIFREVMDADQRANEEAGQQVPDEPEGKSGTNSRNVQRKRS